MTRTRTTRSFALLAAVLAAQPACVGTIGGGDDADDDPGGELVPPDCTDRGPRMLRRLTGPQYRNTLVALFGDGVPEAAVLVDPVVEGFQVDATQAVIRDLDGQLLMTYAEQVADWAVTNRLGQLTTCQTQDDACARGFVEAFGRRAYRQPVPAASIDGYVAMIAAEPSFADGARAVISTMLQSPYVLYRHELGAEGDDGLYHLTPHELASSLAYMLTDAPPDAELTAAADQGRLATREDLDREVTRLLSSTAVDAALGGFVEGWLHTGDLLARAKADPQQRLTDDVRRAMLRETQLVYLDVLRGGGTLGDLLTAPFTYVNSPLASYYGVGGGAGDQFTRVDLPAGQRAAGILGHGSVLTRHALSDTSSPVQRGKLVRERLLCETLPPPPPTVDATLPTPEGAITTRDRYEGHSASPACQSCHSLIDPVGFTFEHFDAFGRWRDQDNGAPVDATGGVPGLIGGDVALDGLDELASYLASSEQVAECYVEYASYHAFGLQGCSAEDVLAEVAASGGTLDGVVRAIVHAPHFTTRTRD